MPRREPKNWCNEKPGPIYKVCMRAFLSFKEILDVESWFRVSIVYSVGIVVFI